MTAGVLLIATNKYSQFVQPLLDGLVENFLPTMGLEVHLFTDRFNDYKVSQRVLLRQYQIPSYKFPEATLYRYEIFKGHDYSKCDYLYYLDVDMGIVSQIGTEILGNLVAVRHPGFYKSGGGSWETRPESQCYVPPEKRRKYYAGGIQGGRKELYYSAICIIADMIDEDEKNGIIPVWHDESAWNCYLSDLIGFKELTPSYCMVEQQDLREKWGISDLPVKIIALAKNHAEVRS